MSKDITRGFVIIVAENWPSLATSKLFLSKREAEKFKATLDGSREYFIDSVELPFCFQSSRFRKHERKYNSKKSLDGRTPTRQTFG